jgi:hypothetical protein
VKRAAKNIRKKRVPRKRNKKVPRLNDPIRIVPLHLPSELYRPSAGIMAPPAAQLTYRGGPLLDSVKVFTIFWGQVWQTNPNSELAAATSAPRSLKEADQSVIDSLLDRACDAVLRVPQGPRRHFHRRRQGAFATCAFPADGCRRCRECRSPDCSGPAGKWHCRNRRAGTVSPG